MAQRLHYTAVCTDIDYQIHVHFCMIWKPEKHDWLIRSHNAHACHAISTQLWNYHPCNIFKVALILSLQLGPPERICQGSCIRIGNSQNSGLKQTLWGSWSFSGGVLKCMPCLQAHDEVEDSGKLRPVVPEKRLVHSRRKIIHMLLLCLHARRSRWPSSPAVLWIARGVKYMPYLPSSLRIKQPKNITGWRDSEDIGFQD